jgi:hypothetical protein
MTASERSRALASLAPPGLRRGFLAAALLYVLLGAGLQSVIPPWEAPDETWHAAYAEALAAGALPTLEQTYEAHHPPLYYLWPALWLRVLGRTTLPSAEHNPHYPFATAVFLHPPGEPLAGPLRLLRFMSSLLALPILALVGGAATRIAGRVGGRDPTVSRSHAATTSMLLLALWPQWLFISHTVNNDTLAVLVGAMLAAGLVRVALPRRGEAVPTALFLGLAAALAVCAKLNVAVLLPFAMLGVVVVGLGQGRSSRRSHLIGQLLALLAGAIVALEGLRLLAPESFAHLRALLGARTDRIASGLPADLAGQIALLAESSWGRLGWMNLALPWPSLAVGAVVVTGGLVGLARSGRRMAPPARWAVLLLLCLCAASLAAVVRNMAVDPQPQGRLLFPSLPALAVLLGLGWVRWAASSGKWPAAGWLPAIGLALLIGTDVHMIGWLLPEAYAEVQAPRGSEVYERLLPARWLPVAVLDERGQGLSQGLRVTSNELAEIAIPAHLAEGKVVVSLVLRDDAERVHAERRIELTAGPEHHWLRLALPAAGEPGAPQRGEGLVLELTLVKNGGDLVLWGGDENHYGQGALGPLGARAPASMGEADDSEASSTARDLVMLWRHQVPVNP